MGVQDGLSDIRVRLDAHREMEKVEREAPEPDWSCFLRSHRVLSITLLPTYLPLPHSAHAQEAFGMATTHTGNKSGIILGVSLTLPPTTQQHTTLMLKTNIS